MCEVNVKELEEKKAEEYILTTEDIMHIYDKVGVKKYLKRITFKYSDNLSEFATGDNNDVIVYYQDFPNGIFYTTKSIHNPLNEKYNL